jgi:Photosynthesis system II assembly factor YCF48
MAAEDRDRLFGKALARHLRGNVGGDSACPDAETLAAYHEGALPAEEVSAAKQHLARCARCQAILAQVEATQSVGELRNRQDELAVVGAIPHQQNGDVYGGASVPDIAARAPKETKIAVASFPARKKWLLRWAAPAGAVAAGLLLYVGLRDYPSAVRKAEPATQIAENREDHAGARDSYVQPAAPPAAPKQKNDEVEAEVSTQLSRQQSAKPAPGVLLDELKSLRSTAEPPEDSKAEKKSVQPPLRASRIGANANTPQSNERTAAVEPSKDFAKAKSSDKAGVAGALQNKADTQQLQSFQAQASGAATGPPAASPSSPAPPAAASQQETLTETAPRIATESVEVSPVSKTGADLPLNSRNMTGLLALLPTGMVASNGKSIWRFGEHGAITHSSDGGKTWKTQQVAVTATLTSGSAPAKNVCWIAGAAGTLLRTTDGGKHWQLIITPIAGDLGGVLASDGKHAKVWDAPRLVTYQTSDGGKKWEKKTAE